MLDEIFGDRDAIMSSDQGRSFRAFWDFLMSAARQDELGTLLERVFELDAVLTLAPDRRLKRIHHDWLAAGEVTQRTVARLSEQLRRYLDDQALLENRRIMTLIRELEQHALASSRRSSIRSVRCQLAEQPRGANRDGTLRVTSTEPCRSPSFPLPSAAAQTRRVAPCPRAASSRTSPTRSRARRPRRCRKTNAHRD